MLSPPTEVAKVIKEVAGQPTSSMTADVVRIQADDYMFVRPDGSVLREEDVWRFSGGRLARHVNRDRQRQRPGCQR